MPCHTHDIYIVALHCEFCCDKQVYQPVRIVCCKLYIQTVSLQNEFDCEPLTLPCLDNTFHIQYMCIYQCEYSCVCLNFLLLYSICHTLHTNTALTCHQVDAQ